MVRGPTVPSASFGTSSAPWPLLMTRCPGQNDFIMHVAIDQAICTYTHVQRLQDSMHRGIAKTRSDYSSISMLLIVYCAPTRYITIGIARPPCLVRRTLASAADPSCMCGACSDDRPRLGKLKMPRHKPNQEPRAKYVNFHLTGASVKC